MRAAEGRSAPILPPLAERQVLADATNPDRERVIAETFERVGQISLKLSRTFADLGSYRTKPLMGGCFGSAGYVIASWNMTGSGLDVPIYAVMHAESGLIVGSAETKAGALSEARQEFAVFGAARIASLAAVLVNEKRAAAADLFAKRSAFVNERAQRKASVRSISRRRRRLFDEGGGRCYYCKCELTLESLWHVDHKFPRALGGGNERENLVVACAPCNLRKSAKTDAEFIAAGAA